MDEPGLSGLAIDSMTGRAYGFGSNFHPTISPVNTLKLSSLLAALLISPLYGAGNWHTDFEAAKKMAEQEGKDLLVNFTGSDWCGWCIKLRKEAFDQEAFRKGAKDLFVLVELDFPRDRSKLSKETREQNEQLKNRFEIRGFPTILLCDAQGRPYARTGYQPGGGTNYVDHLASLKKQHRPAANPKEPQARKIAANAPATPNKKGEPAQRCQTKKPAAKPSQQKKPARSPREPLAGKEAPKPAPQDPPRKGASAPVKTKRFAKMSEPQLKKALGEARREIARIRTAHDESKQGWEKVQSSLKDLRTRVQAKERELTTLRKTLAGEEKKAGTLKKQHASAHAAEETAKSALEAMEKDLKRRDTIAKLEAEAAALQRKAEELRKQAEKLRN